MSKILKFLKLFFFYVGVAILALVYLIFTVWLPNAIGPIGLLFSPILICALFAFLDTHGD